MCRVAQVEWKGGEKERKTFVRNFRAALCSAYNEEFFVGRGGHIWTYICVSVAMSTRTETEKF